MKKMPMIAIVGHTNTGKTSLLRTLTKDDSFGEIKNAPATTRHTASTAILLEDTPIITLADTPGLEDATGVMDFLQAQTSERQDGIERLQVFLQAVAEGATDEDFSQEAKVIRAVIDSDVALYVIDSRFAPTQKYKDELGLLAFSSTPILPVFNFSAHSTHTQAWEDLLARRNLHVYNHFDTVVFRFEDERQLWQNLATLAQEKTIFQTLIEHRTQAWQDLFEMGNFMIADFLIEVASFHQKIKEEDNPTPAMNAIHQWVKHKEEQTVQALLHLYRFYHTKADIAPFTTELKQQDPFDPALIKTYGFRTSVAGGAGAMIGAGIDMATFGASMGLGTLIGGLVGGGLMNVATLKDKAQGIKRLSVHFDTLQVLLMRLMGLHQALRQTGHAIQSQIDSTHSLNTQALNIKHLQKIFEKAHSHPDYSNLDDKNPQAKQKRENLSHTLAYHLNDTFKDSL